MRVPATVTVTLVLLVTPGRAWGACEERLGEVVAVVERVEIALAGAPPETVATGREICAGSTLTVSSSGQVAVLLTDGPVVRFTPGTTVRFERAAAGGFLVRLARGVISLFSRRPHALAVETPFATAAVEGTEFVVALEPALTRVSVLEGRVRVANPQGSLGVAAGEVAVAARGAAPALELTLRPRDAVRWAIYYPPVDAGPLADPRLAAAQEALRAGRPGAAETIIAAVLASDPADGEALALRSVIALARNDRAAARATAARAVAASPGSAAPRIALAYAQQAAFDLEAARATLQEAARVAPGDALIQAQLAEVELALGNRRAARTAAARARGLAPDLARTAIVEGFAALAAYDTTTAEARFAAAIAREPFNPLARLGRGLATIRDGDLEAGRRDLELAVAFDPANALYRSYLGKAYFEERNDEAAAEELATAKELDPNDPTPWFYDAVRKQLDNRPVEALRDLERSLQLNDQRAVYRSRLLLNRDVAARTAQVASIYRDLGFSQLALVQGWRALSGGGIDWNTHQLLADSYASLPQHEIARDSELLQARLLSPPTLQPYDARRAVDRVALFDRYSPFAVGYGDYGQSFLQDGPLADVEVYGGTERTFGEAASASLLHQGFRISAAQSYLTRDGFRENGDLTQRIGSLLAQAELPVGGVQLEVRGVAEHSGDTRVLFDADNLDPTRRPDDERFEARFGARLDMAPRAVGLFSAIVAQSDSEDPSAFAPTVQEDEDARLFEYRQLLDLPGLGLTFGAGSSRGRLENEVSFLGQSFTVEPTDTENDNVYLYASPILPGGLSPILGVSAERIVDLGVDRDQLNPKLGLLWQPLPRTTLRAAYFRTSTRSLLTGQTLEPTNIAGFNQFFDEVPGAETWHHGIGLDQQVTRRLWLGVEAAARDVSYSFQDDDGTATVTRTAAEHVESVRAYLYAAPTDRLTVDLSYEWEMMKEDDDTQLNAIRRLKTQRLPLTIRGFLPSGWLAELGIVGIRQDAVFFDETGVRDEGDDSFLYLRAALGYRLPRQAGLLSIEGENLLDHDFRYQDSDPRQPRYLPESGVLARVRLAL